MKSLNDIEKLSLEDLERISLDESIEVPADLESRILDRAFCQSRQMWFNRLFDRLFVLFGVAAAKKFA